ncbi:MAG: hypothetical protein NC098_01430 [Lachnoclostridium sp.]|nr:hypothetical protein [Lachnoclostridium sp.]
MRYIYNLMTAAIAVAMMASCSSDNREEFEFFSVDVPAGTDVELVEGSPVIQGISFTYNSDGDGLGIIVYPLPVEARTMLEQQTVYHRNPSFADMTMGEVMPCKIGDRDGWKVGMTGNMNAGVKMAEGYSFASDGCVVLAYITSDKDEIGELRTRAMKSIESIQIKADRVAEFKSSPAAMVNAVADLARQNLPLAINEIITWTGIKVDDQERTATMVMEIDWDNATDGDLQQMLDESYDDTVAGLRAEEDGDLLILVPVKCGFTIAYSYVSASDGSVLATISIPASKLQ